jgi:cell shape-determining protein MreC
MEKKVMCGLFEEELNMEKDLKFSEKTEISLVTQMPIEFVSKTLGKYTEYKNMHKLLRQLRLDNQPLPETQQEFQQMYLSSSISRDNPKFKYHKYKEVNQTQRRRHMKKNHDQGYFFD